MFSSVGFTSAQEEVEEEGLIHTSPRDDGMAVARSKSQRWFSVLFR